MFNLIVSGNVNNDRNGSIWSGRVLQYTDEAIVTTYQPNGDLDFDAILSLPTLLCLTSAPMGPNSVI